MATNQNDGRRASRMRPVSDSQTIGTIGAGQGARVATRENASQAAAQARRNAEKRFERRHSSDQLTAASNRARGKKVPTHSNQQGPERTGKNMLILVGGAILALILLFFVVRCATSVLTPKAENPSDSQQQTEPQQVQTTTDDSVTYQGLSYTLEQQEDGTWNVVSRLEGSDSDSGTAVFAVEGTPTDLVLCNGTIVVPENRDGNWDVVAFMISDSSLPTYVTGSDGNAVGGSGSIESVELDGTSLQVKTTDGTTTTVALA